MKNEKEKNADESKSSSTPLFQRTAAPESQGGVQSHQGNSLGL
jgi:hypothetical protein